MKDIAAFALTTIFVAGYVVTISAFVVALFPWSLVFLGIPLLISVCRSIAKEHETPIANTEQTNHDGPSPTKNSLVSMIAERRSPINKYRYSSAGHVSNLLSLLMMILLFAGWLNHAYICFMQKDIFFLVLGTIIFPIGMMHGLGIWLLALWDFLSSAA